MQSTKEEVTRRKVFEDVIRRPYFHVKPLDAAQLAAWSAYLDYMDAKGDEAETRHLFERCLVACARYTGEPSLRHVTGLVFSCVCPGHCSYTVHSLLLQ